LKVLVAILADRILRIFKNPATGDKPLTHPKKKALSEFGRVFTIPRHSGVKGACPLSLEKLK